jgi:chromosome partitioning protein
MNASAVMASASHQNGHVIVIGNHKGGCGKSTVAMHLIIGLLQDGHSVASLDLDVHQQSLSRYLNNRKAWARHKSVELVLPDHRLLHLPSAPIDPNETGRLVDLALELQPAYDFLIIDTPGSDGALSRLAHAMADTLVSPINDSFVDLDLIAEIDSTGRQIPRPSIYALTVKQAREHRAAVFGGTTDWVVVRNRLSKLVSRNQRQIGDLLEALGPRMGFRCAPGLSERVVFREFFVNGLTAFDRFEHAILGVKPSMSHLAARMEMRGLIAALGLAKRATAAKTGAPDASKPESALITLPNRRSKPLPNVAS